jgi:hypothetical protein
MKTTAAPQLIPGIDHADLKPHLDHLKQLTGLEPISSSSTYGQAYTLYESGPYIFGRDVKGEIFYFVRHRPVDLHFVKAGRQILVWSRPTDRIARVANHVFWDILKPRYKVMCSDSQQSQDGMSLWMSFVEDAIHRRGHLVSVMNTADRTMNVYPSKEAFNQDVYKHWGPTSWFQRFIVTIE